MFTVAERDQLLRDLVDRAGADPSVTAAALVGSAARGESDRWSDVDLALRLSPGEEPARAAAHWTAVLAELVDVAHHLDVWSGPALYRVFLLESSLQLDLSFWPAAEFASTGEPFALLFGTANPPRVPVEPDLTTVVGWAWLYALHTRAALARDRPWQAVQMLDGLCDQLITLACLRHELPGHQGRGVDRLPPAVLTRLAHTIVGSPVPEGLAPAFAVAITLLIEEIAHLDPALAGRLRAPLTSLTEAAE
ncbi:nucleotidyltransferase domain-containing protein [uncultured Friedmanniella sp.]|uniref:nucleotidyltransferase domain-containing protein n=1 Tax=uncultured Friedmanniella sp. TaxID=335381 RepID=UPI0035CBA8B7